MPLSDGIATLRPMQRNSRSRRGTALSAALLAALVVAPGALGSSIVMTRAELHLAALINRYRAAHGVPSLTVNPRLTRAARAHSQDMLHRGYFGHGAFVARLRDFGIHADSLGENLAWGTGRSGEARAVLRMWQRSPGHRTNLLSRRFHRVGLGMPVGPFAGFRYTRMVTADFAG
jgi:uncharacterized protein YkwD